MQHDEMVKAIHTATDWIQWQQSKQNESDFARSRTLELALSLMREREDVAAWFGDGDAMQYVAFSNHVSIFRNFGANVREAVAETDFLVCEPAGRGFRVRLIRG